VGNIIVHFNFYAMARSQNSFLKKQLQQNKAKKKKEKVQRKQERQENAAGGALDNMMAYVDAFGNISSTPPEKPEKPGDPEKKD
jgi:hypothetical protein